jgi:hypothetical protein
MSAFTPNADISLRDLDFRFSPGSDIPSLAPISMADAI